MVVPLQSDTCVTPDGLDQGVATGAAGGREPRRVAFEGGFSLVELLVAIFLFGLVLMALTGVLISSSQSIGDQRLRAAATRLATSRLEELRGVGFDELEAEAAARPKSVTAHARVFTVDTQVKPLDAAPAGTAGSGFVKQVIVTVTWKSGQANRNVSYSTAMAPDALAPSAAQAIGAISMFPSPAVTDVSGRPLDDVQVTVPLNGFLTSTLVALSWRNANGTAGTQTLTSGTGLNWRGTIPRDRLLAAMGTDGRGEVQFEVSAGAMVAVYTLALQVAVASPPVMSAATIDRSPVTVARPTGQRTCAERNQCQNSTSVTFTVNTTGLDPAQDSVILQYQLYDGSFQEVPLTPVGDQWRLTISQRSTKFLTGTNRAFRFSAVRSADGATAATAVQRDVISI